MERHGLSLCGAGYEKMVSFVEHANGFSSSTEGEEFLDDMRSCLFQKESVRYAKAIF